MKKILLTFLTVLTAFFLFIGCSQTGRKDEAALRNKSAVKEAEISAEPSSVTQKDTGNKSEPIRNDLEEGSEQQDSNQKDGQNDKNNENSPTDSDTTADTAENAITTINTEEFETIIEAEDAEYTGNIRFESSITGYSGSGYLTGMEEDNDTVTFRAIVPYDEAYDLNFISASYEGHKENNILIDGALAGIISVDGTNFQDSYLKRIYMSAGEHLIKITKNWGWIYLDALKITISSPLDKEIFNVSPDLCDSKALNTAKSLMKFLTDSYGKYIITGQYGDKGIDGPEFKAIYNATGKYPAILGLDLIEYTPSRVSHGSVGKDVEYAIKFHEKGGIVTFCWHWNAPEKYLYHSETEPWWKGFYTEGTNIDLAAIMQGDDEEGKALLIKDIDTIAYQLKRLQDKDIPILFRPLHEASGGWFWWGAKGAEAYIQLYRLLYDRLVNFHDIHNLIWVWNGQNKEWYPGDEYVDIIGTDIYPGERVYSSQSAKFFELSSWIQNRRKIIALTENGCMFDPDLSFRDNALWAYFGTWEGEFLTLNNTPALSEKYTETSMLKKVYNHEKVLTLEELPDLSNYGTK